MISSNSQCYFAVTVSEWVGASIVSVRPCLFTVSIIFILLFKNERMFRITFQASFPRRA